MTSIGLRFSVLRDPDIFIEKYLKLLDFLEKIQTRSMKTSVCAKSQCYDCSEVENQAIKLLREITEVE